MSVVHSSLASVPLDPYLDWAIRNDFRHQRAGEWLPLLVRFDPAPQGSESIGATALQNFASLKWLDEGLKKSVRVPELFVEPPRAIASSKSFNFCVLFVAKKDAAVVTNAASWRRKIVSMTFSPPFDPPKPAAVVAPTTTAAPRRGLAYRVAEWFRRLLGRRSGTRQPGHHQVGAVAPFGWPAITAMPAGGAGGSNAQAGKRPAPPRSNARPVNRPVAVAVFDEGIAFVHDCFRSAAGTRIRYLWNQNGMVGTGLGSGMFGTELTAADIDAALTSHPAGPAGEEAIYRAVGGLDYGVDGYKPLARRRSHGTHVASIACSLAPGVTPAERPIIAVQLPEQAVADPAGSNLYAYIVLGLVYAMLRVQNDVSGGGPLPLVCNISYGPHTGPHDGRDDFEEAVDLLVALSRQTAWPLEVVLAAGNFRQSRGHAMLDVAAGRSRSLQWRVQPQDVLPSFMEIWCPISDIDAITVTATSPLGVVRSVSLKTRPEDQENGPNGPVFWMWIRPWDAGNPPKRVAVVVAVQPTASDPPLDATQPIAPSGVWTIAVAASRNVALEAWIGRKHGSRTRRGMGRQPYFDDSDYVRFQPGTAPVEYDPANPRSYVRRTGTLSGIATGVLAHVVGAGVRSTGLPTRYSSMGPTSGGGRTQPDPDLLAAGDDTHVLYGVLAAGNRSGAVVAMNGSSVAAPQFTHWLAEEIASAPAIPIPYKPTYTPPVIPRPAGVPADAAGIGHLNYPTTWYRVWRPDRPTLC